MDPTTRRWKTVFSHSLSQMPSLRWKIPETTATQASTPSRKRRPLLAPPSVFESWHSSFLRAASNGAATFKLDCSLARRLFFIPCLVLHRISGKSQLFRFLQIHALLKDLEEVLPQLDGEMEIHQQALLPCPAGPQPCVCVWGGQAGNWVGSWGRTQRMRWGVVSSSSWVWRCEGACLVLGSLCVWSLAGSGLCRGNILGPLTGLLATKTPQFCF